MVKDLETDTDRPLMSNGAGVDSRPEKGREAEEEDLRETRCGVFSWRPSALRRCSNMNAFTATLAFLGVFGSMNYSYYTAVITQIEKAYGLSSSMTGFIKNVDNIGFMATVLIFSHFCRYSNKPRLFSSATVLSSVAIFIFALPHFIYGGQKSDGMNHTTNGSISSEKGIYDYEYCEPVGDNNSTSAVCTSSVTISNLNNGALALFVISELLQGMAQSPKISLSLTFMDDNAKKDSPKYFGFMFGMRAFAPVLGFLLGAWTTSIYVDLSDPGIGPKDPRWVGAWWLGFVICAVCSVVWAIPLVLFPPTLTGEKSKPKIPPKSSDLKENAKDLPRAVWRISKNMVFLFLVIGACCNTYMIGFMTFIPKYMEMHFGQTASKASIWSGIVASVAWAIGPIVSGRAMTSFKITPANALKFVIGIHVFAVLGYGSMMFISCPERKWAGTLDMNSPNLTFPCNSHCECDPNTYTPICGADGITYYNPCYAGCLGELEINNSTNPQFHGCGCVEGGTATAGLCPTDCTTGLTAYLVVKFLVSMVTSMSIVPMMTTIMRCVDPKDKALSIGLVTFVTQIVSFPAPVVFGLVIDSACTVLQSSCSRKGACLQYDPTSFRLLLHGLAAILKVVALISYIIAWYFSRRLNLDYEQSEEDITVKDKSKEEEIIAERKSNI